MRTHIGVISGVLLVLSVVVANWLTSQFGFVSVGFGFQATAGTFAAGFALAFRDAIQDSIGKKWMLISLLVAAIISYLVADPVIALASAAAFLVAELVDFAVYTPLRNRSKFGDKRWAGAVFASSAVGAVVDTVIFIAIAFGWAAVLPAMAGQLVGKLWAALIYIVVGKVGSLAVGGDRVAA